MVRSIKEDLNASVFDTPTKRAFALYYLDKLLGQGIPYYWGGDDPLQGFDCNGVIHELLQAVGLEPHGFDCTAHELYLKYKHLKVEGNGHAGCLAFWFKSGKAIHVEMMIDSARTVGASGGGKKVTSLQAAIKYNAFLKPRPIDYRGSSYIIVDPFKAEDLPQEDSNEEPV